MFALTCKISSTSLKVKEIFFFVTCSSLFSFLRTNNFLWFMQVRSNDTLVYDDVIALWDSYF